MLPEIEAAVAFITRLIAKKSSSTTTPVNIGENGERNTSPNSSSNGSSKTSTTSTPNGKAGGEARERNGSGSSNSSERAVLTEEQIREFSQRLVSILEERFRNHWYPDKPNRGQGYRCIRVNQNSKVDVNIERACKESGFTYEDLRLPVELTIWIDPSEVTCRFGEHGSYCTVAKLHNGRAEINVDTIDFIALEKMERAKQQAPFDIGHAQRKKRLAQINAANAAANAAAAAAAASAISASGQMLPQHLAGMMNAKGGSGSPGGNGATPPLLYGNGSMAPSVANGVYSGAGMGSPYGNGAGGALNGLTNGTGTSNGTPGSSNGGHTSPHALMSNGHNFRLMPSSQEFCPQTMANGMHGWTAAQVFTTSVSSANGTMSQQTQQQQMMAAAVQQQQQHFANSPGPLYGKFSMSAVQQQQQQQQQPNGVSNGSLRMTSMSASEYQQLDKENRRHLNAAPASHQVSLATNRY